jgi:hypothetical protein
MKRGSKAGMVLSAGVGYVGGVSGGLAFGIRDFWPRHPTQLDIRGAATDEATVTLWLWSPDAPAMDMRFHEIKQGQDTYEQQLDALNITYEDYEPGFATAVGVARTAELTLWAPPSTPTRERFADFAAYIRAPPQLVCLPERYHRIPLFGGVEICAELIDLLDVPAFEQAWLQYCTLYNATAEERERATGEAFRGRGLERAHSRLTAYAAWRTGDEALAARAWQEFFTGGWGAWNRPAIVSLRIDGPAVLKPIDEVPWMGTNDAAQWGLAAIQNLALVGDALPNEFPAGE